LNIGILGLGVMGRSLALNFERNGYSVAGYDIHLNFDLSIFSDKNIEIFANLDELVAALDSPRRILLMFPAGKPVDKAITSIKGYLGKNDTIIDGGNSFFLDTEWRVKSLGREKIRFIGMGVSGGESGALWGPSLMPGGMESAWDEVKSMLESISAKADDGAPCVAWVGTGGAGHYEVIETFLVSTTIFAEKKSSLFLAYFANMISSGREKNWHEQYVASTIFWLKVTFLAKSFN